MGNTILWNGAKSEVKVFFLQALQINGPKRNFLFKFKIHDLYDDGKKASEKGNCLN